MTKFIGSGGKDGSRTHFHNTGSSQDVGRNSTLRKRLIGFLALHPQTSTGTQKKILDDLWPDRWSHRQLYKLSTMFVDRHVAAIIAMVVADSQWSPFSYWQRPTGVPACGTRPPEGSRTHAVTDSSASGCLALPGILRSLEKEATYRVWLLRSRGLRLEPNWRDKEHKHWHKEYSFLLWSWDLYHLTIANSSLTHTFDLQWNETQLYLTSLRTPTLGKRTTN